VEESDLEWVEECLSGKNYFTTRNNWRGQGEMGKDKAEMLRTKE
jgi:hypothetical protein